MAKIELPTHRKTYQCVLSNKSIITNAINGSDSPLRHVRSESFCKRRFGRTKFPADTCREATLHKQAFNPNYFARFLFSIDSDCLKFLFIALTVIFGMLAMTMPN